ncbi:MAG: hypothetical protein LBP43_00290 [Treponema sp.]|jgi:hypothetical protein|nr:hypothetical protein [Treponema sp.]
MTGIINIGGRREVFWDPELLEEYSAEFRLAEPEKREIVMRCDCPWEGTSCGYFHAFKDGNTFRMYYRAGDAFAGGELSKKGSICLIESADGIHWTRPNLGLIEYGGSRANNIVMRGDIDNFFIFRDSNPACPPEEQYKAVAQGVKTKERPNGGLWGYASADGLSFTRIRDKPLLEEGYFDSLNTVHWDHLSGLYRLYFRGFHGGKTGKLRDIRTACSADFIHWEEAVPLNYGAAPEEQLYTNGILPYYRAPHIKVGFPVRYVERKWEPMFEQLPSPAWRSEKIKRYELRLGTALTDGLFMTSRDGLRFCRWDEPFLRPGPFRVNNWVYGDCYQSWGLLETPGEDPLGPREISFFAGEDYSCRPVALRRYTVRQDGFAFLGAPREQRTVLTKPLVFEGTALSLNMSTGAAGFVLVEFLDPEGRPIPNYSGPGAYKLFGDDADIKALFWRGDAASEDLSPLAGKPVRLRFTLSEARLYAMQFVHRQPE